MSPDPAIIRCLLCQCGTLEASLELHIKYNHLIHQEQLLKLLYKLHYPPVNKKIVTDAIETCEDFMNDKDVLQNCSMSPFSPSKNKRRMTESQKGKGKSPKKRKLEDKFADSKNLKTEESPFKTKKPIRLRKTVHPRKKLQSNQDSILDEDASSSGTRTPTKRRSRHVNGVDYDDVYTRKENVEKQTTAIQKIRQLQENELQCIMDSGTYVQCCDCHKWRLVREIEDPSLVPEYWVCSMSQDEAANDCGKGEGEHVESDDDLVGVEYTCGSLVWIKFKGYPWWPGMVDYCPDVGETFILDQDTNEAAKYHVVFFDKPNKVARSWMEKDSVMKLSDAESPPKNPPIFKSEAVKKRYSHAKAMALDAVSLPKIERIEKYSFVSLFTGKWGELSDDSEEEDRRTPQIDIDTRLLGIVDFQQPPSAKKTPEPRKVKRKIKKVKERRFHCRRSDSVVSPDFSAESNFVCLKCSAETKLSRTFAENHLRKHRLSLQDYLDKFDTPENRERLVNVRLWVQNTEYLNKISEVAERRRSRSGSQPLLEDDENMNPGNCDPVDNLLIEDPRTELEDDTSINTNVEKSKSSATPDSGTTIETKLEPLDVSETVSPGQGSSDMVDNGLSSPTPPGDPASDAADTLAMTTLPPQTVDNKTKVYLKPPMSPELMIAIAVRNLDPNKEVGASCSDIVAFLSLHFPYFTENYEECKDMVRKECGMGSSFESGKENFQMKAEINCGDRIHNYVKNNRDKISRSMLEPEFLDIIIERFVKEDANLSATSREPPPFCHKQLTYIALMKIHKRATLEQIIILLKFIFPSLTGSGIMEDFRKEFLEKIAKSQEIEAKVDKSNITFSLKADLRPQILDELRRSSMDNLEKIGASIIHENFFDITLPIFQSDK